MGTVLRRVFSEGFRIFFLSAGLFGVFSMLVWIVWLGVHYLGGMVTEMPFAPAPHQWHAHEMIFGYTGAALGGFLLTAVPNWTGTAAARHIFVATAAGIWILGRLAIWYSAALPLALVAVLDLAFLPILAAKIASQLVKRPKPQNMMFLLFLTLIWIANLLVHLEWMGATDESLDTGLRTGLLGLCSMIAVLGGRVTPAFTRNAMKRAELPEAAWPVSQPIAERGGLALALALPVAVLFGLTDVALGTLAILAGLFQAGRLSGWRIRWTLDKPILLALHLSMLMLAAGLLLWGLSLLGIGSEVAALHVLGIGAVGGMTLAVMSRAVFGHTGRPLVAPSPLAIGYLLVAAAAIIRWLGSELSGDWYFPAVLISGGMWVLAFTLYIIAIWPAVTAPRQSPET